MVVGMGLRPLTASSDEKIVDKLGQLGGSLRIGDERSDSTPDLLHSRDTCPSSGCVPAWADELVPCRPLGSGKTTL